MSTGYPPAKFIEPPPLGYIHVAAAVRPPAGRAPFPGSSPERTALLDRLKSLARQLEGQQDVIKATVYRAVVVPPVGGDAKQARHPARYDVVVLIETTSPEVIPAVQATEPYKLMLEAVTGATDDIHVMTARCVRRIGDVDKTRPGLFLFNYFVAEDPELALRIWEQLAGWYVAETRLDNSTLLAPIGDADYVLVNHARWDYSVPGFMLRQFTKPSFFSQVPGKMRANRIGAMPLLYRLA